MLTEQDLREAMAAAVDDAAAERFTIGLSDRALAQAGERSWSRWVRFVAVGSALAVAAAVAAVGVVAVRGGGSAGPAGGGSPASLKAPDSPAHPLGGSAVIQFGVTCFDPHGPKLDMSYVWDPSTRRYRGVDDVVTTIYEASPDGKQALVLRGELGAAESWAVADWPDAVAGRLTQHPITDKAEVHWSADGKEVVSEIAWDTDKDTGGFVLKSKTADFYDPASGRLLASLALPRQVLAMAASGQWQVQQWQGDHDSALFPVLSVGGDRLEYLNARGDVVRTLTFQEGLSANGPNSESVRMSADGRYLAEYTGPVIAVFDLAGGGKRIGLLDGRGLVAAGWIGDHEMMTAADTELKTSGHTGDPVALTGHSPVYTVLSPDFKPLQQAKFVLPADPRGTCSTWPMSWAPAGQFPGAFVP